MQEQSFGFRPLLAAAVTARQPRGLQTADVTERAAVCLIFTESRHLLLIRRSEREGDPWSGHMAFPGGRMESVDGTSRDTAARETREEVGTNPEEGLYLGALDDVETPVRLKGRRLVITPHVWWTAQRPQLVPNVEVGATLWIDVERLISGEGRGEFPYAWRGTRVQLPVVRIDGAEIWGITLRIIDDVVQRLSVNRSDEDVR